MSEPRRRALWRPATTGEESRAYLQARLTVFVRLMLASFVALSVFLAAIYRIYPQLEPAHERAIIVGELAGLAGMVALWRGVLARGRRAVALLYAIDLVLAIGIGVAFAGSAVLAPEFHPAAWTSLIFSCFGVLTRALVIPSSGRRTAVVSALAFVPLIAAAVWLAATADEDLPGPAFVGGALVVCAVVVAIARAGSRTIYGLRQQVSEAMQLGQYTLGAKLGEGGMGAVYLAHHALLRRPTAIKLLLPDRVAAADLDRFEREVQHTSELTHPNTVAVFDYGRSPDGVVYYAMEYLGGGIDLENLVARHGAQPASRVVHILAQICGALAEAHARGIVHRDIKPANIILCERGGLSDVAKVVDFGLVQEIASDAGDHKAIVGTPAYLAPEAITSPGAIGPAADLYALGAVGYFLLTGQRAFTGTTTAEICTAHVTRAPRPPSEIVGVPAALEALVLSCLAKLPAERPASAGALATALRELPRYPGWDDARAQQWWREVRDAAHERHAVAVAPTLTMQVELDGRG